MKLTSDLSVSLPSATKKETLLPVKYEDEIAECHRLGDAFHDLKLRYANPLIIGEYEKKGKTNVVMVFGDREIGKTSALDVMMWRAFRAGRQFLFVLSTKTQAKKLKAELSLFGWILKEDVIYVKKTDKIVGFFESTNTPDNAKNAGYRNFDIEFIVFEEVIREKPLAYDNPNLGRYMSSIMASAWGQNKLNRWRELGLQAFFFSNNSHANHPILYKYGGPTKNAGIERKNPRGEIDPDGSIVFISAVNHDQKQVHELLNLDGYATQAYGRKLIFDETIKVGGDGDLSSYQHFCDISIFGTETSLLMNEQGYYLAEQPIKEPNENDMIILGSLDVRDYVHTNLLESLFQYHKMRKLKFGNWRMQKIFNEAVIRHLGEVI